MNTKVCGCCKNALHISKFSKDRHRPDGLNNKCRECAKKSWRNYANSHGIKPMSENKECSQYLGISVAENILSKVFNNVQRMPLHNHGFDFICNKGFKIDVKSSCVKRKTAGQKQWQFDINKNAIANYFLLIAFDNSPKDREDLKPCHLWLVPGNELNKFATASINEGHLAKWSQWEQPLDKVVACCDSIKNQGGSS